MEKWLLTAKKAAFAEWSRKFQIDQVLARIIRNRDVETEEGESLTVVLATDSCGVWMSEGYYYSYGSDSQPLYDLFGVTLEFGKFVE